MKATVLRFGLISAALSVGILLSTLPFIDSVDFRKGDILGYTGMVLSALLVFFGVRSVRERDGGRLTFGRGLKAGLLITLIACAFHVVTWEVLYFQAMPDLGAKVAACMVARARAGGASAPELAQAEQQAQRLKEIYDQPALNVALTFAVPFSMGLAFSAISAAILRKK